MKFRTLRESQARFNFYVNARPSIHTASNLLLAQNELVQNTWYIL